jgi:hypothetical protein
VKSSNEIFYDEEGEGGKFLFSTIAAVGRGRKLLDNGILKSPSGGKLLFGR